MVPLEWFNVGLSNEISFTVVYNFTKLKVLSHLAAQIEAVDIIKTKNEAILTALHFSV